MLFQNILEVEEIVSKWQKNLLLKDWEISVYEVKKEWKKTGDIKIDSELV